MKMPSEEENYLECFLADVFLELVVSLYVLVVCELVPVHSVSLMNPQPDKGLCLRHAVIGGKQQSLEHIGQVSEVEDVVELDSCWRENLCTFCMKSKGGINNVGTNLLDIHIELVYGVLEMILQNCVINGEQRVSIWENNG